MEQLQDTGCTSFLQRPSRQGVSGDTRLHNAWGPVWHAKPKAPGVLPERLRGVDREATWGQSHAAGWGDGPGSFCWVSHRPWGLGAFQSIRHSAQEAKRGWRETGPRRGVVETVIMASTADAQALLAEVQRQRGMPLVTTPRKNSAHSAARQQMISVLNRPPNRRLRQPRGPTGAPRQGVVQDILALERCGRRGHRHTRWLLAVLGVTVPRHQARALNKHHAGWKRNQEV